MSPARSGVMVRTQLWSRFRDRLENKVVGQIHDQFESQLYYRLQSQLHSRHQSHLPDQLWYQFMGDLR